MESSHKHELISMWVEILARTNIYVTTSSSSSHLIPMAEESRKHNMVMDSREEDMINKFRGIVNRVRVVPVKHGPKKKEILLYYGKVDQLHSDLERYNSKWLGGTPFMEYTTNIGRSILRKHHKIPSVMEKK